MIIPSNSNHHTSNPALYSYQNSTSVEKLWTGEIKSHYNIKFFNLVKRTSSGYSQSGVGFLSQVLTPGICKTKSFKSYRLRAHNFLRVSIWCKKNVSCSTSTKKTHLRHQLVHQKFSHRESCRSSLFPVGDAAVHCAQLSSPELAAACKCKTWQPLLVV